LNRLRPFKGFIVGAIGGVEEDNKVEGSAVEVSGASGDSSAIGVRESASFDHSESWAIIAACSWTSPGVLFMHF